MNKKLRPIRAIYRLPIHAVNTMLSVAGVHRDERHTPTKSYALWWRILAMW